MCVRVGCWRVSSRGWSVSWRPEPPGPYRSSSGWSTARCHPRTLKHTRLRWGSGCQVCWNGWCVCVCVPLTAAGKGLANFSTYSASCSAWLDFPLKMICTAPWEQHVREADIYWECFKVSTDLFSSFWHCECCHGYKDVCVVLPWLPSRPPLQKARRSSHPLSGAWSS